MKAALAYFFPIFLFGLLIKFGDIGERGMILILLYAVLVLLYLLGFGVRHLWRKKAPPLNALTIVCWLTITFFLCSGFTHFMTQLYLASGSPRRKELLAQTGVIFERIAAPIDETPQANENPRDYVLRMAVEKAESGWRHLLEMGLDLKPVLASDTSVVLGDEILGKPLDAADAAAMLKKLAGTTHEVLTSLALRTEAGVETVLNISRVTFAKLNDAQIAAYIASGEPMDKAGAYGIQGIGGVFVAHLDGSYTGVMGLPLHDTAQLLARHGLGSLAI